MSFDLETALATTPYPQKLTEAAALASSGQYIQAVVMLGETIASLEKSGVPVRVLTPFLQLSADSLRRAAARFASSSPYSPTHVDLRLRIGWLEQALEQYNRLKDLPNLAHTVVALAKANLEVGESIKAVHQFKQALNLATPLLLFSLRVNTPQLAAEDSRC